MRKAIAICTATLLLALGGCAMEAQNDEIRYAAEYYVDEDGLPQKGEPPFELAAVLRSVKDKDGKDVVRGYSPYEVMEKGEDFDPTKSKPIDLAGNQVGDRFYTVGATDLHIAHFNPHRAYSPYAPDVEVDPTSNVCPKTKKLFRIIVKEAPCWRCGGTKICPECFGSGRGQLSGYAAECWYCGHKESNSKGKSVLVKGECPECDSEGFVKYYGALPDKWGLKKRKNWKFPSDETVKEEDD